MRAGLRVGPDPAETNAAVVCLAMIETAAALESVERICAVPDLDGVYIGPSDLSIAMGAVRPGAVADIPFEEALTRIRTAAETAGIACGIHCPDGTTAKRRLAEGFTLATVSSDLLHLERAARSHYEDAIST
jgi:4-hydroxy-2-oxoheptanedioate aldolase